MTYEKVPSGVILHYETSAARVAAGPVVSEGQLAYDQQTGKHYRWDGSTWDEFGEGGVGGGAPTDADYLVGTANGDLSAEIVVGATPGGELDGTWASPTVDATHAGSTHSAATDTHIADTTNVHDHGSLAGLADDDHPQYATDTDLTTHAGAADPHAGYRLESADHTHQTTGAQAGQLTVAALSDAPAGELGGTWASPTVDATHSGSTHAATQAAAEATAAAANTADIATHAGLADPHTGYRLESADHTHASTGAQAGLIPGTSVTVDSTNLDGTATNVQTVFEELETQVQSAASTHAAAADPHAGYVLESLLDAAGDLIIASAADTPAKLTRGADDTFLRATGSTIAYEAIPFSISVFLDGAGAALATGRRPIWNAAFPCTVTAVKAYVDTGTTTVVNAGTTATAGAEEFCSADITIDPADAWESGTVNQNQAITAGETVSVEVITAGTATQITIQIDLTRP